jgi:hypothetical protein
LATLDLDRSEPNQLSIHLIALRLQVYPAELPSIPSAGQVSW